jgi:hypothetical protein
VPQRAVRHQSTVARGHPSYGGAEVVVLDQRSQLQPRLDLPGVGVVGQYRGQVLPDRREVGVVAERRGQEVRDQGPAFPLGLGSQVMHEVKLLWGRVTMGGHRQHCLLEPQRPDLQRDSLGMRSQYVGQRPLALQHRPHRRQIDAERTQRPDELQPRYRVGVVPAMTGSGTP